MSYKHYLKLNKDGSATYIGRHGAQPKESIGEIPDSINREDYPFLKVEKVDAIDIDGNPKLDIDGTPLKEWKVSVDEQAKSDHLLQVSNQEEQAKYDNMRAKRDQLLADCDYTQLADSPLSVEMKQEFVIYRQALRDLPENIVDIDNIVFPSKPE